MEYRCSTAALQECSSRWPRLLTEVLLIRSSLDYFVDRRQVNTRLQILNSLFILMLEKHLRVQIESVHYIREGR